MRTNKWLTYLGRGLFVLIFGSLILGLIYEQSGRFQAKYKYRAPGTLVTIDGHQMHYVQEGTGGPTVVFESGLTYDHSLWQEIQPTIAQRTSTLSYDRSGLLWSDRGTQAKDAETISKELFELLEATQVPKPYILVGHSIAGCTLRPFIRDHAADIAGIIFVDTSHPEQDQRGSEALQKTMTEAIPPIALLRFGTGFGPTRMMLSRQAYNPNLDIDDPKNLAYRQNFYKSIDGIIAEIKGIPSMLAQAQNITSFGAIPLTVITANKADRYAEIKDPLVRQEMENFWSQLQKEQTQLSTNSQQVLASQSSHMIPFDQPELIITAIQDQLEAILSEGSIN